MIESLCSFISSLAVKHKYNKHKSKKLNKNKALSSKITDIHHAYICSVYFFTS